MNRVRANRPPIHWLHRHPTDSRPWGIDRFIATSCIICGAYLLYLSASHWMVYQPIREVSQNYLQQFLVHIPDNELEQDIRIHSIQVNDHQATTHASIGVGHNWIQVDVLLNRHLRGQWQVIGLNNLDPHLVDPRNPDSLTSNLHQEIRLALESQPGVQIRKF